MNYLDKKVLLADADSVILDWPSAFENWLKLNPGGLEDDFSRSTDMNNLPAFLDSKPVIDRLVSEGYKFHVITAVCTETPGLVEIREKNLYDVFGQEAFHDITCVGFKVSKLKYLQEHYLDSGLFWLEDNINNYWDGITAGLRSVLVETPINKSRITSDMTVIQNFEQFYDMVHNV